MSTHLVDMSKAIELYQSLDDAKEAGYAAGSMEESCTTCPYPMNCFLWDAWQDGWNASSEILAEQEAEFISECIQRGGSQSNAQYAWYHRKH